MIRLSFSRVLSLLLVIGTLAATPQPGWAGPGAHGPNGEHLDVAPTGLTGALPISPRIEAKSDLFELVGTLAGSELSILIDRFDTNEPVLNAQVEVESGGIKAIAKFHGDVGSYSVDDPVMLKKLSSPGEHPLVILVLAGQSSDLLDAVLRVKVAEVEHAHDTHEPWWLLVGLGGLTFLGIAVARLRKRRERTIERRDPK